MEIKTLPAGTVVHLNGIPLKLLSQTKASTSAKNWKLTLFAAEMGKKGGSKTSTKKTEAVRKNGLKGGRPKLSRVLSQLNVYETTLATNEPINRREGKIAQANLEAAALKECKMAKKILQTA